MGEFVFDVLFWSVYTVIIMWSVWVITQKHYGRKLKQERAWTDEAIAGTERIAKDLESTRKLNVEIARELDTNKHEVGRLADQRKELLQKLLGQGGDNKRLQDELDKAVGERAGVVKVNHELAEENTQLRAKLEDTEKALDINDKAGSAKFMKFMEAKKLVRAEVAYHLSRANELNVWLKASDFQLDKAPENAPKPNSD